MLAMSFGRALVAPRLGALNDLPEETGYFYDASDNDGLRTALRNAWNASTVEVDERGTAGLRYALEADWTSIASRTFEIYSALTQSGRKPPRHGDAATLSKDESGD